VRSAKLATERREVRVDVRHDDNLHDIPHQSPSNAWPERFEARVP
jgi:hypothetical protein